MSNSPSANKPANETLRPTCLGCFNLIAGIVLGGVLPVLIHAYIIMSFALGVLLIVIGLVTMQNTAKFAFEEQTTSRHRISVWHYLRMAWVDVNFLMGIQIGIGVVYSLFVITNEINAYLSFFERPHTPPDNGLSMGALGGILFLLMLGYLGIFLASSTLGVLTALRFKQINFAFALNCIGIGLIAAIWFYFAASVFQPAMIESDYKSVEVLGTTDDTPITVFWVTSVPYILWFIFFSLAHRTTLRPLQD